MSLVTGLTGRTYDVSAFRGQTATGLAVLDSALFNTNDPGEAITGIVKLAQWFVIELLTIAGSDPYDPTRGTNFMSTLLSGGVQTDTDLFVAFGFAVGIIRMRARQIETATTPTDEQFSAATITSATIAPGQVSMNILLTSAAGTARPVLLPLPTF